MKRIIKKAWINKEITLVSFREVAGSELFMAEEDEFWTHILKLMQQGYMIQ